MVRTPTVAAPPPARSKRGEYATSFDGRVVTIWANGGKFTEDKLVKLATSCLALASDLRNLKEMRKR